PRPGFRPRQEIALRFSRRTMAQDSGWSADGACMSNAVPVPARGADQTQPTASPSLAPAFSYAFQPIVDTLAREIFSYEALIRGPANEAAFRVLELVPDDLKHQFDQDSRIQAINLAVRIGLKCNLNFLPRSSNSARTPSATPARLP